MHTHRHTHLMVMSGLKGGSEQDSDLKLDH